MFYAKSEHIKPAPVVKWLCSVGLPPVKQLIGTMFSKWLRHGIGRQMDGQTDRHMGGV